MLTKVTSFQWLIVCFCGSPTIQQVVLFYLLFLSFKKTSTSEKLIPKDSLEDLSLWQDMCTQVQKSLFTGISPSLCCTSLFLHWQRHSFKIYMKLKLLWKIFARLSFWWSSLFCIFWLLTANLERSVGQSQLKQAVPLSNWGTEIFLAPISFYNEGLFQFFFFFSVLKIGLAVPQHLWIIES